jgi:hypothetical protein
MDDTKNIIDSLIASGNLSAKTLKIKYNPEKHFLGVLCARNHAFRGKSVRGKTHGNCMICMRLNTLAWKIKYPDRVKVLQDRNESSPIRRAKQVLRYKTWRAKEDSWLFVSLSNVKKRAKEKNIPFNLTIPYLKTLLKKQQNNCHWLKIPLQFEGVAKHALKPSLDRLIPEKGYVKRNVVWSTNFANRARGDMPVEEFKALLNLLGI